MWSTIANLKENLNKIAQDVHDDEDDDDLEIYGGVNGGVTSPVSDRRNSHGFAHSMAVSRSPLANGIDSANNPEVRHWQVFLVIWFEFLYSSDIREKFVCLRFEFCDLVVGVIGFCSDLGIEVFLHFEIEFLVLKYPIMDCEFE